MKKIFYKIFLILFVIFIPFIGIHADIGNNYNNFGLGATELKTKFGNADVPTIAGNAIKIIIGLSASVMLVMILWSGIELMFSSGEAKKRQAAINRLIWTSVGIIIIVSAYAISQFVINQINFLAK